MRDQPTSVISKAKLHHAIAPAFSVVAGVEGRPGGGGEGGVAAVASTGSRHTRKTRSRWRLCLGNCCFPRPDALAALHQDLEFFRQFKHHHTAQQYPVYSLPALDRLTFFDPRLNAPSSQARDQAHGDLRTRGCTLLALPHRTELVFEKGMLASLAIHQGVTLRFHAEYSPGYRAALHMNVPETQRDDKVTYPRLPRLP